MAVAHAVTAEEYPELNYQHSWDSINYCMNNSQECRGAITYGKKYIIAVFQDTSVKTPDQDAMNFFKDAPEAIVELAKSETFQYVLENIDGKIKPYITAAFWGTWNELYNIAEDDKL